MSLYEPNQSITEVFHEYANTTGLVQSDFHVSLYKDGVLSIVPPTIAELTNGDYRVSFTPDSTGIWSIDIVRISDDAARYGGSFPVRDAFASQASITTLAASIPTLTQIASSVWDALISGHLIPGSVGAYLNRIKKYTTNRLTQSGNTYSVKEDNGVDEFEHGTTTENERTPQ